MNRQKRHLPREFLPILLAANLLAGSCLGKVISFKHKNTNSYALVGADLRWKVRHPFKVVIGSTKKLWGRIKLNPDKPGSGINISIAGKKVFDRASVPGLAKIMKKAMRHLKVEHFNFSSTAVDIMRERKGMWDVQLFGNLQWKKLVVVANPVLKCQLSEDSVGCEFNLVLDVRPIGLDLPTLLMVPVSPMVEIWGTLNFARE